MLSRSARTTTGRRWTHYLCMLDFEANCGGKRVVPEIIEFPSVLLKRPSGGGGGLEYVDQFERFCKPTHSLTSFCTKLTTIRQDQVNLAKPFKEVLAEHQAWLDGHTLRDCSSFTFVTCGDGDLRSMLPFQCQLLHIEVPARYKRWINIQQVFQRHCREARGFGLKNMLLHLDIAPQGVFHRGIADCHNTAKVAAKLHDRFGEGFAH